MPNNICRKANDKVSGRKKPRVGDLPYVAAPDSTAAAKLVWSPNWCYY